MSSRPGWQSSAIEFVHVNDPLIGLEGAAHLLAFDSVHGRFAEPVNAYRGASIRLEAVLANVTFDIAWLQGEEAPVVPVDFGLPGGSRRSVTLDGLIFSAAVSW